MSRRHDAHWELWSGQGFHFLQWTYYKPHVDFVHRKVHMYTHAYKGFISKASSHCMYSNVCVSSNGQKVQNIFVRHHHFVTNGKQLLCLLSGRVALCLIQEGFLILSLKHVHKKPKEATVNSTTTTKTQLNNNCKNIFDILSPVAFCYLMQVTQTIIRICMCQVHISHFCSYIIFCDCIAKQEH